MAQELTRAQQQALDLTRNISVTAGAGSGKTKILVDRFLKIVLQDAAKTRRILAITFTNKAAGEMRERVAEKVTELLRQSEDPARAARLRRIRDQLNSAAISTFHSFCARVLREFPVQAGLPPEFNEMDEIRSYILRQEAIDRAIQSLDDDDSQNWIALFSRLSLFRVTNMLNVALEKSYEMEKVERLFSDLSKETFLNFLHQQWFRLIEPYLAQLDRNDFDRLVDRVVSMIPPDWQWHKEKAQKVFERLKTYRESRAQPPDSPQALTALMEVVSVLTTQKNGFAYKNLAYLGAAKSWPAACKNPLVALSELSAAVAAPLVSRGLLFGLTPKDDEWYEVFNIFLALYRKTAAIYRQLKQSESGVDFNDLQLLTLKLLESHDEIRRELSRRFDYIMVDEFQDTDELQWQIVKKIAGDARDKLFVVGDPKQSIYGFRNADIRVFKKVKQEFARQAGVNELKDYDGNVVFTESFRFLPLVNRFVNRVFSRILTEEEADPYRVGYHALETRRDLPGKGHVEVTVLDETQREAEYVAWQIERLIAERQTCYEWQGQEVERPLEYGDMAILLRRRNELLEVEQALRDRGIPFKTAGGIGFWQRQEIYDIYHLLRFVQNPQDDFALLAVLRAGFFVLSDEWLFFLADQPGSHYLDKMRHALQESPPWLEAAARQELTAAYELLNRWRKLYDRIPLEDLLRDVMAESHYTDILASQLNGEQAVANVEKLILQAHHFDETGSGGLAGFLTHLTDLIEEEMREGEAQVAIEDRTTVKIMTIHGAKGLQFPVVFLPFLNTKVGGKSTGVHMDGELGMAAAFESAHDEKQDALLLRLLKDRQRRKDLAEARRLFYVGVTRASNYLFLSAQLEQEKSPPEDSWFNWLHQALMEDGLDVLNDPEAQEERPEIHIRREFPQAQAAQSNYKTLINALDGFAGQLEQPAPKEEIPDYLKPVQAQPGGQIFSATRILTFVQNPEEYYQRYLLGFFEQDYKEYGRVAETADDAILWGKVVHRFFQLWAQQGATDDELTEMIFYEHEIFDPAMRKRFKTDLQALVQKVERSPQAREIVFARQGRNEQSVLMRLGDDYFTGTIDRMFVNKAGHWEVVDYKTNHVQAAEVAKEAAKYEWQVKSYALLLGRLFPEQPLFPVSLYFLHPNQFVRKEFTTEEIAEIADQIKIIIQKIKTHFPVRYF